jgi:hypothetical protein
VSGSTAPLRGFRPVGAAGSIFEKFGKWADLPKRADGSPDVWSRFSEEQLLTNIMLYVAPSSVVTATWIYHGKRLDVNRHGNGTLLQIARKSLPRQKNLWATSGSGNLPSA